MKGNKKVIALTFLVIAILGVSFKVFYNAGLQKHMYGNKKVEVSSNQGVLSQNNLEYKKVEIKKENKGIIIEVPKDQGNNLTNKKLTGKVIVIDPGHANRFNLEKEPLSPGTSEF